MLLAPCTQQLPSFSADLKPWSLPPTRAAISHTSCSDRWPGSPSGVLKQLHVAIPYACILPSTLQGMLTVSEHLRC